ncbi:MAG TPA: SpoIIE family protein phosphatase [Thermoanaerobaculia bacterium]|nr:SpoIIE family protein phosphatase [Thermoanaerobaculia bacterium]
MSEWCLRVTPPHGDPYDHDLEGEVVTVGRASDATVVLPDRFLSRHHARLVRQGDAWALEDLGSRNGTLLNGRAVEGSMSMMPGDVISLSATTLSLHRRGEAPPPAGRGASSGSAGALTVFRDAGEMLEVSKRAESADPEALRNLIERMRLLHEVHQGIGHCTGLDELLNLVLDRVFQHLQPEEAVIFLADAEGELRVAASRTRSGFAGRALDSRNLAREVVGNRVAALVLDATVDDRFAEAVSVLSAGVRSILAAPLLHPEGCQGMIVLDSRVRARQFGEQDLELLVSLASVAAMGLRNVLLSEEAAQRRLIEHELDLARRLQVALLPLELPQFAGYELQGSNLPSRGVSGDYYTGVSRADGRECFLMIADVAGKGVGASLLTASLEALCAGPITEGLPPDTLCDRVGRRLLQRTPPERYATAFCGSLDVPSGTLCFANAGHPPPLLLRRQGEVERLARTGPPLGLLPGATYGGGEVELAPGDVLVTYSDGVTEAENPEGEQYGIDRLEALLRQHAGAGLETVIAALESDLSAFTRGTSYADDRTLLLLRRSEPHDASG